MRSPRRLAGVRRLGWVLGGLGLGLALLLGIALPRPALAHARLVSSDPPDGAVLTSAPTGVQLQFSEDVSPQFSEIAVFDRARTQVNPAQLSQPGGDTTLLHTDLPPDLHNGTYTVIWRILSADDGHVTLGSYTFTLQIAGAAPDVAAAAAGTPGPDLEPGTTTETTPASSPFRWIWRALVLIGAAGLLGAPLFSSLILAALPESETAALAKPLNRRLAGMVVVLAGLALVGLLVDMLYQVASLSDGDVLAAFGNLDLAGQVIISTGFGAYWALKVVATAALLGYGVWRWGAAAQPQWPAAVMNAGFLFAGEALGSHEAAARAVAGLPLGMVGDLIHLLGAGAWIGGLLYLAVVFLPVLRRAEPAAAARLLGRAVPRFSNVAMISVAVLIVTGVLNLALHTLDPGAIVDSDYGRVLILKHVLFLPLLALGAVNNGALRPRLTALLLPGATRLADPLMRRFGRLVGAEAVLGAGVLCCAAALTLLPPPVSSTAAAAGVATPVATAPPAPTVAPGDVTASDTVGGVRFDLVAGMDSRQDHYALTVSRVDTTTAPLLDVLKLQMRVTPQDLDAGSTSLPVTLLGSLDPDRQVYTATGRVLTTPGGFQLDAELFRGQSDDLSVGFRLILGADGRMSVTRSPVVRAIVTTRPAPPIVGPTDVTIRVIDGREQPVTDAALTLTPFTPAGQAQAPVREITPVAGQPGVYQATVAFTTDGPWRLVVAIARPNQPPTKVDTTFDVIDLNASPTPAK